MALGLRYLAGKMPGDFSCLVIGFASPCLISLVRSGNWSGDQLIGRACIEVPGVLRTHGTFSDGAHFTTAFAEYWPLVSSSIAWGRWSMCNVDYDEFALVWTALLPVRFEWGDWHCFVQTVGKSDYDMAETRCFEAHPPLYRALWQRLVEQTGEKEDLAMEAMAELKEERDCGNDQVWQGMRHHGGVAHCASSPPRHLCCAERLPSADWTPFAPLPPRSTASWTG